MADVGRRNFDADAPKWDQNPARRVLTMAIVEGIRARVPLQRDWRLMDYGAGTGVVALALSGDVAHVLAVDSSAGMLEALRAKAIASGVPNVQEQLADLEAGDEIAGPFEAIVSSMTLHHIHDPGMLIGKLTGLLAPGGWLAVADLDEEPGTFHPNPAGVHHHGFGADAMRVLFEGAGLTEVEVAPLHTVTRPVADGSMQDFVVLLSTGQKP